jgi:hypothetical protein
MRLIIKIRSTWLRHLMTQVAVIVGLVGMMIVFIGSSPRMHAVTDGRYHTHHATQDEISQRKIKCQEYMLFVAMAEQASRPIPTEIENSPNPC